MRDDKLIKAMARAMWDQRWKDLQSSPIREFMGANTREWECKEPDVQEAFRQQARAALAAAEAAGYRMVREARECRHCGWLCAPNNEQSKSWYPLEQAPAAQESGDDGE